jgi:nucleotide-binding universal stress UspA family protein
MFTRILAPLDGSPRAEESLPFARELALADGAQIFLLHVEAPATPETAAAHGGPVERRLEAIARELRGHGIATHTLSLAGQTPATIAAAAEVHGIDLIVLAPESRRLLETLWKPSVTAGVLARTPIPVLIAPRVAPVTPATAPRPLLADPSAQVIVPLDGSPLAEQALVPARRMAERYERGLLLLRVVPPLQVVAAGPGTYPLLHDEAVLEVQEAGEYLSALRTRLQRAGHMPVQFMVGHGIPADEIVALAETKPDSMLVMSTHGRGGLARFVLGSVALEVARRSPVPLLITPGVAPESPHDASDARRQPADATPSA